MDRWWQAKENPTNLFERAPIFFTLVIVVWVVGAAMPLLAIFF